MTDSTFTPHDPLAWVAGSDAPEKSILELGYMPLSDAASVIVAATQGFGQPYGLTLNLQRQPSWSSLRDKLASGELDAAHSLYGMVYGTQLGLSGTACDMAILMGLSQNGQSINLSSPLRQAGVTDAESLVQYLRKTTSKLTFAQTFPTGTHAMWLNYWLASHDINPLQDVNTVVVPPPQMVAHLQAGRVDGFCVGGPWGALAIEENQGFTVTTTQAIWPNHPEKVLACTREFAEQYPNTARALTMALLEASRFIDESEENRRSTAQLISGRDYLNAPLSSVLPRFLGHYEDGVGHAWLDSHPLNFHRDGEVNMPWLSDGMWFLTQFRRWGLLRDDPDYEALARQVQQLDLYRSAAEALGVAVPNAVNRSATLFDGSHWDGSDPAGYARSFAIHALGDDAQASSF